MTTYNSEAPVLDTYHAVVAAYSDFLTVAIHTILYERNIYPQASFIKARKYDYPVRQSRHPKVCKWVMDAVAAVKAEMLKCTVAKTSLILYAPPPTSQPLERYVFSTESFPRIPSSETLTTFASNPTLNGRSSSHSDLEANNVPGTPIKPRAQPRQFNPPPTSDLPEQFRATLARLTSSLGNLKALPEDCSFTLAMELRDDEDVDPPLGGDGAWIAAEPNLQKEVQGKAGTDENRSAKGGRTTPVRSLEAGAFRMEVWVEEGKGKFQAHVEDEAEEGRK